MKIGQLARLLKRYKKTFTYYPEEGPNRNTHCYLVISREGKVHRFEVRYWNFDEKKYSLKIYVVNWTVCAGPAIIEWNAETIKGIDIKVEDL